MSTVNIHGEEFTVDVDEDGVWLVHPRWSLLGHGDSILDAELSLYRDAQILYSEFGNDPPSAAGPEWFSLISYCQKLTAIKIT